MAVALRHSRRFAASSPVTRYWLANCVGFSIAGGGRGTVERVLADDDPYEPSLLEVRTGRRSVRRVPTSAVVAVVPSEQLLVVERRRALPDRRRSAAVRVRWSARIIRRALVVILTLLAILAVEVLRLGRRAWAVGSPAVARTGRRGGSEAARLVRSVPWQSYGRSARSATTRLSRARSTRSSRRRSMSSARRSANGSSDEVPSTSST
jgi:hypothetical protein